MEGWVGLGAYPVIIAAADGAYDDGDDNVAAGGADNRERTGS